MHSFAAWIRQNAAPLDAGHALLAPIFFAHPTALGFADAGMNERTRTRTWTRAMRDGRLVVVDEYAFGQCIVRLERNATRSRSVTAAVEAVVDAAETGIALFARGLVELGARL